mmetsp:Transcript_39537/g.93030  ORF Transcript_39537/g.93030 Transcript_39537/m.93030 type:complete len:478 (-) Transcript_39537:126-1559(-)
MDKLYGPSVCGVAAATSEMWTFLIRSSEPPKFRPRSPEEYEEAKEFMRDKIPRETRVREFREVLMKHYRGSMVNAWRDLDKEKNGRFSFFIFCQTLRELGYPGNMRTLWRALDENKDGFLSLYEVDLELATLLEKLAIAVWASYGSVAAAWQQRLDPSGSDRCPAATFIEACQEMAYAGDAIAAFRALRVDKTDMGLHRKDFEFLDLWFKQPRSQGPLVDEDPEAPDMATVAAMKSGQEEVARIKPNVLNKIHLPTVHRKIGIAAKETFKRLLQRSYGNFVRAWRRGLDFDGNGRLDKSEFARACDDIGYVGDREELWEQLDVNSSGFVVLGEIDRATTDMLEALLAAIYSRGSWRHAWDKYFDKRGDDKVDRKAFVDGCRMCCFGGNAEKIFELLDVDRCRHLSLADAEWICGGEAPHYSPLWEDADQFSYTGSGKFRLATRENVQTMDETARAFRVQKDEFWSNHAKRILKTSSK